MERGHSLFFLTAAWEGTGTGARTCSLYNWGWGALFKKKKKNGRRTNIHLEGEDSQNKFLEPWELSYLSFKTSLSSLQIQNKSPTSLNKMLPDYKLVSPLSGTPCAPQSLPALWGLCRRGDPGTQASLTSWDIHCGEEEGTGASRGD